MYTNQRTRPNASSTKAKPKKAGKGPVAKKTKPAETQKKTGAAPKKNAAKKEPAQKKNERKTDTAPNDEPQQHVNQSSPVTKDEHHASKAAITDQHISPADNHNNNSGTEAIQPMSGITQENKVDAAELENDEVRSLKMERQNTKHARFRDEKAKTDGNLLKRENTMIRQESSLERQNTKHTRFSDERSKTEGDLALRRETTILKSRPGTSLDGHQVDWVDCTESLEDLPKDNVPDRLAPSAPPFNENAVLKGEENEGPVFPPGLNRDNVVVWPFGNGTITLPKPPPRQPRPPILSRPDRTADRWVRINIGGSLFYTRISTLRRCPGSRLTDLVCNDNIPDEVEREYRFDRSPVMFAHILDYYRHGDLHIPQGVCASAVRYELDFWKLPPSIIAPCCWETYARPDDEAALVSQLDGYDIPYRADTHCCPIGDCRRKLWLMLDFPASSWYGKLWSVIYALLVIASTLALILDTVQDCRVKASDSSRANPSETNPKQVMLDTTNSHPVILVIEIVTSLFFSVDLLLRFYCCVSYWDYVKDLLNWADLFSVIAEWVLLVLTTSTQYWDNNTLLRLYTACSFIRVLRVLRLFRLARTYSGLRLFLLAMTASIRELLLLVVLLMIGIIIFSTAIYYAEFNDPANNFPNIPFSFWWAIVTMTTVGYGDFYPTTPGGYVVGALCATLGLLAIGLPIPIIATNFQQFYEYSKVKDRLRRRQRLEQVLEEQKKVQLPSMKTWSDFPENTYCEDDMTRASSKTTYHNRAFSPSDSGVFDDQSEEKDHSDRPKGARPNRKDYNMLRNDSIASDMDGPATRGNEMSRNATTLSTVSTNYGLSRFNSTLPDIGSSSPRISSGSSQSNLTRQNTRWSESNS